MPVPRKTAARPTVLLALFAAALALYLATGQVYLFNDGPMLASGLALGDASNWRHVLAPKLALAVRVVLGSEDGVRPWLVLSALAGAVATASTAGLLVRLGVARGAAIATALAVMLSPALWFHATTVELHAVHAAAVTAAAHATVALPWGRRGAGPFALCVGAAAVLFGLAHLAHLGTVWLGLGWVALAAVAADRAGAPRGAATWLFVVGPTFLAASLVTTDVALLVTRGEYVLLGGVREAAAFRDYVVGVRHGLDPLAYVGRDWFAVAPALWVLALLAFVRRTTRTLGFVALAGSVPALVAWGDMREDSLGGYFLSTLPFVAIGAGVGLGAVTSAAHTGRSRLRTAIVVCALVLHAVLGWRAVHDSGRVAAGELALARVEDVRALLPNGGYVLSAAFSYQLVTAREPSVVELDTAWDVWAAGQSDVSVERAVAPRLIGLSAVVAALAPNVLWDRGWRTERETHPELDRYIAPFEELIERHFDLERIHREDREYWRLLGPRAATEE